MIQTRLSNLRLELDRLSTRTTSAVHRPSVMQPGRVTRDPHRRPRRLSLSPMMIADILLAPPSLPPCAACAVT